LTVKVPRFTARNESVASIDADCVAAYPG